MTIAPQSPTAQPQAGFGPGLRQDEQGIWFASSRSAVSYPAEGSAACLAVEDSSFWFQHRNRCIVAAVRRFAPRGALFDIGGGNGFVARALADTGIDVVLVEPSASGALSARRRGLGQVVCATLSDIGLAAGSLQAAGLFDVIEHTADDTGFVRSLAATMAPGALLYATVPAHAALWSHDDAEAGHFRRYGRVGFGRLLTAAGFEVLYQTYFFRPLLLPIVLARALPFRLGIRPNPTDPNRTARQHGTGGGLATSTVLRLLAPEVNHIERGEEMRFGASILVVARKT